MLPFAAFAQVQTHTVQAKENFSSIGRLYDINGRVLAEYNNLSYEGGLSIGQVIKIPPSAKARPPKVDQQKVETTKTPPQTPGSPFYHTVGKKETLYHISTLYPQATVAKIKEWNKLSSEALSEGQVLIVGFGNEKQAVVETVIKEKAVPQKEAVKESLPVVKNEAPAKQPDVTVPVYDENGTISYKTTKGGLVSTTGGYFKNDFDNSNQNEKIGEAGIFKSTSGWDDEKYYCLYNDARPGTILKVTNPATDKFIFAKVLDVIPDLKENSKVVLRLSNSAADVLGVSGSSFDCKINY